jgi:hypothetical protein
MVNTFGIVLASSACQKELYGKPSIYMLIWLGGSQAYLHKAISIVLS